MFYALLTLFSALSISAIAAYFSIIGLATIFPGSMAAVITMGTVLEIGKIVAAIWLHRNWKRAPWLIKTYLIGGVIVLMGITSMGIFGFLSKSHIEHAHQAEKAQALVTQVDAKIAREQQYIERQKELIEQTEQASDKLSDKSETFIKLEQQKIEQINKDLERDIRFDMEQLTGATERLKTLDKQLSDARNKSYGLFEDKKKIIQRLIDSQAVEREELTQKISVIETRVDQYRKNATDSINAIRVRIEQYQAASFNQPDDTKQRVATLNKNINDSLDKIDALKTERFDLDDGNKQLEAEVGPIKYVVEMIADMTGAQVDIEDAVRWMIVVLIFVFDPLAILLVIAAHISLANQNIRWFKSNKPNKPVEQTSESIEQASGVDTSVVADVIEKNFNIPREFLKQDSVDRKLE